MAFKFLKNFFKGYTFEIDRDILKKYVESEIEFSKNNQIDSVSEFVLMKDKDSKEEIYVTIIDYDIPNDMKTEIEKNFSGIVIWVNDKGGFDPTEDEHYCTIEEFIDAKLNDFGERFVLKNELGAPKLLEPYAL